MSGSGWRVVIEDDGQLRALCKIQSLADGGYSVLCPYHEAREGWLFKLPVGLGYGPRKGKWISADDAVHYTASDRAKLSHHRDGLVQFSSEVKGKIRSGINPLGIPKGIGVFSVPIDVGVPTGPAFGISAWGLHDYKRVEVPRTSDLVFRQEDMGDFLCTPSTSNGYSLEGWLLHGRWRPGIYGESGDKRIRQGGTSPSGEPTSRELRVVELRGTKSFLGVHVSRMFHSFPGPSGFLFGGSRNRSGDQIVATYPRPDGTYSDAESLDYTPET
ncbi:hypothetical protein DFJ75_3695 [Williamsia muralis]|uniref:Uncharacterized protein n=1 Tax=Williamsia marianensis TaxID=85044 RepID=A0A495K7S7_WILMA|nr:hypothetical protein DFJ75_3695 [Williamsia muralis]